jgi:uncharacterized protein (TIGR03118 family)
VPHPGQSAPDEIDKTVTISLATGAYYPRVRSPEVSPVNVASTQIVRQALAHAHSANVCRTINHAATLSRPDAAIGGKTMTPCRLAKLAFAVASICLLIPASVFAQHYTQTNLVTDATTTATAAHVDPNLKNPWGMARSTGSPWWFSDNNAGLSTLYDGAGNAQALVVKIPGPNGSAANFVSSPTGTVFNGTTGFGGAHFIFVTEDGTISAWTSGAAAALEVDNSANPSASNGAVYKGCTLADFEGNTYLYVTNFRSGHLEVYDTNFKQVTFLGDHDKNDRFDNRFNDPFEDEQIPRGYAPFNVQNIGGSLFVTYAKQDKVKHDDIAGAGNGFVDVYSPGGRLETRLEHGPWMNSPWGAVWTPRDFGFFSNRVLIGNFGSGQIAAFDGFDGRFIGLMEDPTGKTVVIDGLWGLTFGNSAIGCPVPEPTGSTLPKCGSAGPYNSLFFTAGPNGEANGLFGTLTAVAAEQDGTHN